ncbi:site-specific DNA-methyltransferase [Aurantiacibacter rhizosphaerae]|uniref:site-specific DNA-methyltransferase (adenine-specific) n=1 Tax=Aurantiacibacter rhizosphaerae TaxID=2691582 RepID=A0A844XAE4_9SPHN|nr:site-specific DNA-methyltransferase [Aurantiacibacter rhizosphaerae]MWV26749.1 site-specific DNA-methyltransferase [Aurantiacibacter rhizosphaerae]
MARSPKGPKQVGAFKHDEASRRNIPTAEMESFFRREEDREQREPIHYPRSRPLAEGETREREEHRDPQLIWNGARIRITPEQMEKLAQTGELELGDAQLVWRGKDTQDWSDLIVNVPPLYIQEKIHPKAIIDDLKRRAAKNAEEETDAPDLFGDLFLDFNGIDPEAKTEFYQHDQHWSNRMILGDSLQVMASLAEREALRGKVQCIYFDPPYGIKFGSNWQVSTQKAKVLDGKQADIAREPEQVKAFRDTWKDGIHSYLTYLRDRLVVMRDLLADSGSIFIQISDENVHRVRAVLDEVFGEENFVRLITFVKTSGQTDRFLASVSDYILWYARDKSNAKYRQAFKIKSAEGEGASSYTKVRLPDGTTFSLSEFEATSELPESSQIYTTGDLTSQSPGTRYHVGYEGAEFFPKGYWKTEQASFPRLIKANRIEKVGKTLRYVRTLDDYPVFPMADNWTDTGGGAGSDKVYVVQTGAKVVERCIQMVTDPGDLVLDPTCGSGTTATVCEQWGRRWITIDTSRVALALARTRLMSSRYPWYLLADSEEGRAKEADLTLRPPSDAPVHNDVRQGFIYERVPHITLKSIANNARIDEVWERWQRELEPLREALNHRRERLYADESKGYNREEAQIAPESANPDLPPFEEWTMPREPGTPWPDEALKPFAAAQKDSTKRATREKHLAKLNEILGRAYTLETLPDAPVDPWDDEEAIALHAQWWEARIARQKEIDEVIAKTAETEYLYDKPYEDPGRVRVAGPFTVESLSPHRVLPASEDDSLAEDLDAAEGKRVREDDGVNNDFAAIVIEYLKSEGVKQQEKGDRIRFESVIPWPGQWIGAEGRFMEGPEGNQTERRAAIFIGPEFGTTGRSDLVAAAREAVDNRFDLVIACAFNFDAHSSELDGLGSLKILKARINPDMHMSDELKNTGSGNMFVVFGEPDVEILDDGGVEIRVKVNGVDVFDPNTGDIRSNDTKGIAAWFIDTDYNEESFFVRHAYFLGANDPYSSLKTALKAEIDEEAWSTLYSDTSRPFERPDGGRIAVKVINHFGDEVMKVFGV